MFEIILLVVSLLLLILIFVRRWYLHEKISLFGKMVLKKGLKLPGRITKDDIEVTVKEMIPDESEISAKLRAKGESLFKKAEASLKVGDKKEAEKFLIQCLAMNPAKIEAHNKLGVIYLANGQNGKAELIFRKLIQKIHDDATYLSNLALSLFNQEKFAEAKDFYEKAIELDAHRSGRFFSLANCNYELGEKENAIENVKKAIELDHNKPEYLLTLAQWYLEMGMKEEAKGVLQVLLEKWPEDEMAKELWGQVVEGE